MFSKYNTNNVNHYMLQIDFEIKEKNETTTFTIKYLFFIKIFDNDVKN